MRLVCATGKHPFDNSPGRAPGPRCSSIFCRRRPPILASVSRILGGTAVAGPATGARADVRYSAGQWQWVRRRVIDERQTSGHMP